MSRADWENAYLRLNADVALKHLETPFVYHIGRDELYEIDSTAAAFLRACNGTKIGRALTDDGDFVRYCIEEGILAATALPDPMEEVSIVEKAGGEKAEGEKADPSLRYLELHLTHRCNLRCGHCYIGEKDGSTDMAVEDAVAITRAFAGMGGLRLLISGGEPLVYPDLAAYLQQIAGEKVRRVLFTNGTLIDKAVLSWLDVHEIQFSLDGWETGHERLRGKGTFKRTMDAVRMAKEAGIAVSFSTMIHRYNMDEFDRMAGFMDDIGAVEWGVDVMCRAGDLVGNESFLVDYEQCVPLMAYGFGGGYHGSSEGYACGRHLMTVMPDGRAAKCGFYMDTPVGDARQGIESCWEKIAHIRLGDLECGNCAVIDECRGGCRFRAPGPFAPDPVMCRLYGVLE